MKRSGRPVTSLAERFWPKVDKNGPILREELGPCWVWKAGTISDGYGKINIDSSRKLGLAHRISYGLVYGPYDESLLVLHRCDNPPCVNPSHLFLGTPSDNSRDMITKGRQKPGGAKLRAEDVRQIRQSVAAGETQRSVAKRFGVHPYSIGRIVHRITWSHVP